MVAKDLSMKLEILIVGKTTEKYIEEGIHLYLKRIKHYLPVSLNVVMAATNSGNKGQALKKESDAILKKIHDKDFVVLLDERGKEFTSIELSGLMNKSMVNSVQKMIFIVGGPYGVSEMISSRANLVMSFSQFTLTHQMIRIFLVEQLYRSMTILNNEPYHHV